MAFLAPNARWQGRDQTGQPVAFGKLYTYINKTMTPKATYQDYQEMQPNTNPITLDAKGEANVYWADDDLYTIKLFTSDSEEVYTQDDYPIVGSNTATIVQQSQVNVCRNEQFSFWSYGNNFSPVTSTGSQSETDFVCNDWLYKRVSSSYTVNISQQTFPIDQTDVPGNPKYFFRYQCPSAPSGESNNSLYQRYQGVQTFANQFITFSIYAESSSSSTIDVYLVQTFGTGGSPSADVVTLIGEFDLTSSFSLYSGTVKLPSLQGKNLGTNGDDALILRINFPNDVAATIDLCDVQMQQGQTLMPFAYDTLDTQFKELTDRVQYGLPSTGDWKVTLKTTADPGWLMLNDQTIGNPGSGANNVGISLKALYTFIWNQVLNTWAPIYDSSGNPSTRGASAEADFNALKRLALTKALGRALAVAGTATGYASPSTWALGEYFGEEDHILSANEGAIHSHGITINQFRDEVGNIGSANSIAINQGESLIPFSNITATIGNSPGGNGHNTIQPTIFVWCMMKI